MRTSADRADRVYGMICLMVKPKKIKVMSLNCLSQADIKTSDGFEEVNDFTYLGSIVSNPRKDITKQICIVFAVYNTMSIIWKSTLTRNIMTLLFRTTSKCYYMEVQHYHPQRYWQSEWMAASADY